MRLVNEILLLFLGKKNLLALASLELKLRLVREPALTLPVQFALRQGKTTFLGSVCC